jgi:hypothetical protein
MHKDSNLQQESANTRKHILELFNDEKEAEKKKAKLNDDYNKLNTESQVSMEKMEMGPALKEANATIRIDYECIKYFDDGSLLISLESGRLAIISNPMDSFDSGWYYSYVVQDGTTGITRNDDGVHLTIPEYRMVDVEGNNRIIYQHQQKINALYAKDNQMKTNIREQENRIKNDQQELDGKLNTLMSIYNDVTAKGLLEGALKEN